MPSGAPRAVRRIFCAAPSLGVGGAERVLNELTTAWRQRGLDITIAVLADEANDAFAPASGIEVIHLGGAGASSGLPDAMRRNRRRLADLDAAMQRTRPDVVLGFTSHAGTLAVLAASSLQIPAFLSERNFPPANPVGLVWGALRRLAYRRATGVIMQTERAAEWARARTARERVQVIPNPLAPSFLAAPSAQEREASVLYVGRLAAEKRPLWAIRAFAAGASAQWRLVMIGDGPLRAECEALANDLGIGDRVDLLGVRRDVPALMARSSVMLASSLTEGFPNAILEAMASGCAVVSTDCPAGPAELLERGAHGLLTPVDNLGALGAAVQQMTTDAALRARCSQSARLHAMTYAPARVQPMWDTTLGIAA